MTPAPVTRGKSRYAIERALAAAQGGMKCLVTGNMFKQIKRDPRFNGLRHLIVNMDRPQPSRMKTLPIALLPTIWRDEAEAWRDESTQAEQALIDSLTRRKSEF